MTELSNTGTLVGATPRYIRIILCVPNLVMVGPVVWPPILDRQAEFVLYRYRYHHRIGVNISERKSGTERTKKRKKRELVCFPTARGRLEIRQKKKAGHFK